MRSARSGDARRRGYWSTRVLRLAGAGLGVTLLALSARAQRRPGRVDPPAAASAAATPAIVSLGSVDPKLDVNFSAMVSPRAVYVGQQATYQIGVFLSDEVRQRLRRNPEFMPSDVRSMLTYDLPTPSRALSRAEGGRTYEVHVFQRALFPLTPGSHALGAARLTYALPLSSSFFSREENHTARTAAFTIVAREPPSVGRPTDYAGAVGRLALAARTDAVSAREGDPVVLTVTVSGIGNVSLFPRPPLSIPWGEAVAGAERVAIDSNSSLVQGRKEFEWVVTPKRRGNVEVPSLRYPFFNPYSEQYEVALSPPIPLRVTPGALATAVAPAADSASRLTVRTVYRGPLGLPVSRSPWFWFGLVVAPLPALALGKTRPGGPARRPPAAARLRAVTTSSDAQNASGVRRAFADAIGERTGIGPAAMSDARAFVRALRRAGVTVETARDAQVVLADLDRAVYGGADHTPHVGLRERAFACFSAIDGEAVPAVRRGLSPRPRILTLLVLAASLGATGIGFASEAADAAQFARGVAAYGEGRLDVATKAFDELARRVPRAADAWANMGTAAWEAHDTATAAIGWQRALRLEPLASDVRDRLDDTPGFRGGAFGDVPLVSVTAAAVSGAVVWWIGWSLLAVSWRSRRRDWGRAGAVVIAVAAAVGWGTVALDETVSGRHDVIVVSPDRLRAAPALGSEFAGEVMTGERARSTGAESVWTRVRLYDGRSGWIQSRHLASLDIDRAP